MPDYYILDGHEPVPTDHLTWARWFEASAANNAEDRRVAKDDIGPYWVSTVFLGLDHQWEPGGPPLLFETIVFSLEGGDEWMERCATWAEAEAMHQDGVGYASSLAAGEDENDG